MKIKPVKWKWITGYEGRYEVSSDGRVRSYALSSGSNSSVSKEICQTRAHGYKIVHLWLKNKVRTFRVCRLVLFAFRGSPPDDGFEASHINGVRSDDNIGNLI